MGRKRFYSANYRPQGRISRAEQGFTLIELVMVLVIIGVLAAAAAPKLLDLVDDANEASVQAVAGGFATATSLVRSQWLVEGKENPVDYDGQLIYVTERGWPSSVTGPVASAASNAVSDLECREVFEGIVQNAPVVTHLYDNEAERRAAIYAVRVLNNGGVTGIDDLCVFELITDIDNADPVSAPYRFTYDLGTGQVETIVPL